MKNKSLSIIVIVSYFILSVFIVIGTFSLFSVMTKTYNLKTQVNNNQIGEVLEIDAKYKAGDSVTLLASTKTVSNYDISFDGWFIENELISEKNQFVFTMPENDVEITGKFSSTQRVILEKYTLSFETNGDFYIDPVVLYENEYFTKPQNPVSIQRNFVGWYFDMELTDSVEWPILLSRNTTVYAKWVNKEYKITWDVEGKLSESFFSYGEIPVFEDVPEKEKDEQYEYEFSGWQPAISPVTANIIYQAQFQKVLRKYLVTWIIDGVETKIEHNYGDLPEFLGVVGKEETVADIYNFIGWAPAIETVKGNVTYTAQFSTTKKNYHLRFESNGGSSIETISSYYNSAIQAPGVVVRSGYDFAGWFLDSAFTNPVAWPLNLRGDTTVYAKWSAVSYKIVYFLDGGANNALNPATYTLDNTEIMLEEPTKNGYKFDGWYRDSQFTIPVFSILGSEQQNIVLYAKWSITSNEKAIIVGFSDEQDFKQIKVSNITTTFNFNDYILVGSSSNWMISSNIEGNNTINSKIVSLNVGDNFFYLNVTSGNVVHQTLLNVRRKPMYNVKYVRTLLPDIDYIIEEDANNTVPANPIINGYTFTKWDKEPNVIITTNIVFTAEWREHKLDLSYANIDGATKIAGTNAGTYNFTGLPLVAATYKKDGYTFTGWSNDDTAKIDYVGGAQIPAELIYNDDQSIVLTAQWRENELQLNYVEIAGATKLSGSASDTYKYTNTPLTAAKYTKPGFEFKGWSIDGSDNVTYAPDAMIPSNLIKDGDVTLNLTAVWREYGLVLEYENIDGATKIAGTNAGTYDFTELPLVAATYKKDGYEFKGWSIDGSKNVTYAPGASIDQDFIRDNDKTLTLTAVWHEYELTLVYEEVGEAIMKDGTNSGVYKYSSTPLTVATFEKPGFSFGGWMIAGTDIEYNSGDNISYDLVKNGDLTITFTALWSEYGLTIQYNNIAGATRENGAEAGIYVYSKLPITLAEYTRPGYEFLGWSIDGSENVTYAPGASIGKVFIENNNETITLTAVWRQNKLTLIYDNLDGAVLVSGASAGVYEFTQLPITVATYSKLDETFLGWDTNNDGIEDILPGEGLTADILDNGDVSCTLSAVWRTI